MGCADHQGGTIGTDPHTRSHIEFWRHKGKGPKGVRIGSRVLYRQSDVEKWLAEQFNTPQGGGVNLEVAGPRPDQEARPAGTTTSTDSIQDRAPLRQTLDDAIAEANGSKLSMKDLTVLSPQVDPFRIDTPANHRDGQWLAEACATLGLFTNGKTRHLRGLHYAISQVAFKIKRPDGSIYINNDPCWEWLNGALKAARWLGYIDWELIDDNRNDAPELVTFDDHEPWEYLSIGLDIEIPDVSNIEPNVGLAYFTPKQPYKLVLVGEKSSLKEELLPIAKRYGADLYLPKGNISDPFVHQIAKIGHEDGRPMVVLYFSDGDPSGWNMPIELGRKLQAFKASLYPDLEFRQYRALLTPDQIRQYDLPISPLKESERRADKWRAAFGVEQTEVDALVTLRPELFRELANDAIAPFFDKTLVSRARRIKEDWRQRAQAIVDASIDQDHLERVRAHAEAKLAELRSELDAINEAMRFDISDFDVPAVPVLPEPIISGDQPLPLLDSSWSFVEQCKALIDSKAYRIGGDS
jgi:hypothetical protein